MTQGEAGRRARRAARRKKRRRGREIIEANFGGRLEWERGCKRGV
jgi:hypothetical protein